MSPLKREGIRMWDCVSVPFHAYLIGRLCNYRDLDWFLFHNSIPTPLRRWRIQFTATVESLCSCQFLEWNAAAAAAMLQQHMVIHHLLIIFNEIIQQMLVSMKIKLTIGIILFLDGIDITVFHPQRLRTESEMDRKEKNWTG